MLISHLSDFTSLGGYLIFRLDWGFGADSMNRVVLWAVDLLDAEYTCFFSPPSSSPPPIPHRRGWFHDAFNVGAFSVENGFNSVSFGDFSINQANAYQDPRKNHVGTGGMWVSDGQKARKGGGIAKDLSD